ncbi:MAG: hypothetical protein D6726_08470 [Nitrospirae bacterium]|nr:MAG: hypothetical protein D6726_08470 [Nitrospirota bacterium]
MRALLIQVLLVLFFPAVALATQEHGGSEGLVAHELGHIFFIFSMTYLYLKIRSSRTGSKGIRWIGRSAVVFVFWNIVTFVTHIVREMIPSDAFRGDAIHITGAPSVIWYIGSLSEHLFLVAAILLFLAGANAVGSEMLERTKR